MQKYFPYILLALPFFLLKITNLGIWLSDTNIYFYTGYKLLEGKILYRDIFFTNFPLLPYISAFYFFLTNGNLPLFFFTAAIEVIITGFFIYKIILDQEKTRLIALLSAGIYLYSFIVLATSDHQTGVFMGSLFAVISYFFFTKKKWFLTGVFIALALLTKAYFLPIFLAILITLFLHRKQSKASDLRENNAAIKQSNNRMFSSRPFGLAQGGKARTILLFLLGCSATAAIVLLPSLLLAPHDLFKDVISYSLTRSQGIPKANIARFFLTHDSIFVLLLLWNMLRIRRQLFFGLVSLLSLLFFLFYQDVYYLYLNFCIPFLALSFPTLYNALQKIFSLQKMVIPTVLGIVLLINLMLYVSSYRTQQKIENIEKIVSLIKKQNPSSLYGINSLTPALAYMSNTPLLGGVVDTNENIYRKGFLDKRILTKQAVEANAILITSAAVYPAAGVNYPLLGGIFDEKAVNRSCTLLGTYFIKPEGVENAISVWRCQK